MSKPTRRVFFEQTMKGVAVGAGVAALHAVAGAPPAMAATNTKRAYTAGKFAVLLDNNAMAGWVHGIDGGDAYSEVVIQPAGADRIQHKHLAGVKYEDLSLKFGTGMSRGFYEWIKATLARGYPRKNGAIVVADFNFKETARLTFGNGLITEIEFPALDAGSKDAAAMTIDITPANTRWTQGSGGAVPATNLSKAIQSKWLPANFRLQIAGLNTTKVNKIDALTFKLPTVSEPARAEERMPAKQAGVLQVPNLVVTLASTTAAEFYKWFDDFVIRGNGQTKTGTLEYLTPNLQGVLFTLSFKGLGIFKLKQEAIESGSENIRRVKAEMYCEDVQFGYGAEAAAG